MPRKFIKRYIPDPATLRKYKSLDIFGEFIHSPNLWHLNKRSVSGAFSVGLFCAFVPIPFQMVLAAGVALISRVNLPVSIALVWLTNPITMPPIFYFAYRLGAWILSVPAAKHLGFELSVTWLKTELLLIWQPFLLGCFILGVLSAGLGNAVIRLVWRISVVSSWRKRSETRKRKRAKSTSSTTQSE